MLSGFPSAQFSDGRNLRIVCVEVVLAAAALLFLRARKHDIRPLYPEPTLCGALLGVGLFFVCGLVGEIVTAPFHTPENPGIIEFSFSGVTLSSTILMAMVNGTFEEIFLLGVLVRGLRGFGLSVAIGFPLLVRLLYHLYQGPVGVLWVSVFGVTLSLTYLKTSQLWPPVLAHILWDIVPTL